MILSPKFERVQIIPGVCHDNIQISCLDCSVDSGKIAAAYANQIIIFEPTPILPPGQDKADGEYADTAETLQGKCFAHLNKNGIESNIGVLTWKQSL